MPKNLVTAVFAITALSFVTPFCLSQSALLDLPRESQHSVVAQRIGITDITISYHRPLVKGRTIWGKVVPYGQVWRAGANENTTISFSDPVTIEGKPLAKGVYGLHMIPGENDWTVIFSNDHTAWGSFTYKEAADALRVSVKPHPADMHEALTYDFDDVKADSAVATLCWEKVAVPFKIGVNVHEIVQASLHHQLQGLAQYTWEGWDDAATYLVDSKYDLDEALQYEDRSIQNEERFDNLMTRARILDGLNRRDDAKSARDKALAMGSIIQLHGYGRQLQSQGQQEQALEIFRMNIKKDPNHWVAHNETARLACAKGDFATAAREMKLAENVAPEQFKPQVEALVKRLEAKEDINKN